MNRVVWAFWLAATIALSFAACSEGENAETVEVPTSEPRELGDESDEEACSEQAMQDMLRMDRDQDGVPDVFDEDWDNDDVNNETDNCPWSANPDQADEVGDGRGDACRDEEDPEDVLLYPASPAPLLIALVLAVLAARRRD